MRVLIVLGTRPEIIRLSRVISRLDELCELVVVHTGQNSDELLSDVFFRDLGVRAPDHHLGVTGGTFAGRVGRILTGVDELIDQLQPDRMLVLGDTDSAMSAYVAKRRGGPVFHMEAGNRCFDDRVPEEVNRRRIDQASDILMPYTGRSRMHLLEEGFAPARILVTGNPIKEVLDHHAEAIAAASPLDRFGLHAGGYLLLTLHRQETVDDESRLRSVIAGARRASEATRLPVLFPAHPRTSRHLSEFGIESSGDWLVSAPPLPFFDFVACERRAACVLTDSGTVQEECCIFGVPAVTVRDSTERLETVECGSNILSGVEPEAIERSAKVALSGEPGRWEPPAEYLVGDVSTTVCSILLGHPTGSPTGRAPAAPG
jgi:UDP-N-acetylglucosamine 2-epimerase (non-hydrolysing)